MSAYIATIVADRRWHEAVFSYPDGPVRSLHCVSSDCKLPNAPEVCEDFQNMHK